ncbi:MAG: SRPBCC family protein [Chlamydiales bacterium]|nr:SRPBCC family protein [Chlamydiales bacterium]
MHTIKTTKKIRAPYKNVWQLIWEIKAWAHFWEPLQVVDILYEDGMHQDFVMSLSWQNRDASIRTVRFCAQDGTIHFFSPVPPFPTTIHQGSWKFASHGDDAVELTATRWFELPMLEKESTDNYLQRLKIFSQEFQVRLETLLERLGTVCEK